jgi:hypothetical protein
MVSNVDYKQSAILALLRWWRRLSEWVGAFEQLLRAGDARWQVLPHRGVGGKQLVAHLAYEYGCWHFSQPEIRNALQNS